MNQFRFNEGSQTQWDNVKLSTDPLFYPPLTTITSISSDHIFHHHQTLHCIPWETSCCCFFRSNFHSKFTALLCYSWPFSPKCRNLDSETLSNTVSKQKNVLKAWSLPGLKPGSLQLEFSTL